MRRLLRPCGARLLWGAASVLLAGMSPAVAHDDSLATAGSERVVPEWVGPAHSGSWFVPSRAGEGWTLQILDDGRATVVWFTFAPAGGATTQAWILGQDGVVDGARVRFSEVFTARGPRFGPGFDPAALVLDRWGTLEFEFSSCTQGVVRYSGPASHGAGSHAIERLTRLHELDCGGARSLTARGARAASALRNIAGAFVDPAHGGEGWVVEPLSDSIAGAYWFTYDTTGRPAWLVGLGTRSGGRITIDRMLRPQGTAFGDAFDADDVARTAWGRVEFEFDGCDATVVRYASTEPGFGDGALSAQRLTRLASATCLDAIPTAGARGTWSQGTPQLVPESEIAATVRNGSIYSIGGFVGRPTLQRYDATSRTWSGLAAMPAGRDHAMAAAYGDSIYVFGGLGPGRLLDIEPTAFRYDVAANTWHPLPGIPFLSSSGAAALNGFIYVGDGSGDLLQFDPRTHATRRIPAPGDRERDHSQLVAFLGELWLLGGRATGVAGAQRFATIFDPVSETWRDGPPMRAERSGFAAAVVGNRIMVAGGELLPSVLPATGPPLASFEILPPGVDEWTLGPPLPTAVHGVGGAEVDGRFYAVGGSARVFIGGQNTGTLQVYAPGE